MKTSHTGGTLSDGGGGVAVRELEEPAARRPRHTYPAKIKARLVLESMKGERSVEEIAEENDLPVALLMVWRRRMQERLPMIFDEHVFKALTYKKTRKEKELERQVEALRMRIRLIKTRAAR